MKGLVVLGMCAMNMFGFSQGADVVGATEKVGGDLSSTSCNTHVSTEKEYAQNGSDLTKNSDPSITEQ